MAKESLSEETKQDEGRSGGTRVWSSFVLAAIIAVVALTLFVRPWSNHTGSKATNRGCGQFDGFISPGESIPSSCRFEMLGSGSIETIGTFRQGSPMVLNFWASWCPYCIKEMPGFQRVYQSVGDRVRFLGLDLLAVQGETKGAAITLAGRTGVKYPLGYDEGGALYFQIAPRLLMPTTVFVRANGIVAYRQYGRIDESNLRRMIKQYLGV